MYYRMRYYDTERGRFISRDPIGHRSGDVVLYLYAGNNSIIYYDPMGLTTIGEILDAYFSKSTNERLWIMPEDDEYTQKVREWQPVVAAINVAKKDLEANCTRWEYNHRTHPKWKPGRTDPPVVDPFAWGRWVPSPPGTDPNTAGKAFVLYKTTGRQTDELWTSAIGSFGIYVTYDEIDCCAKTATLSVWMYNAMDRQSFGRFANMWVFRNAGQARQYMWWHWSEEHSWGASPTGKGSGGKGGGGWWW
jgi:hypothetical protein